MPSVGVHRFAVYGLRLTATKGRRSHEHIVRRDRAGSWEESEKTEWYGPSGPLEAIADVVGLRPSPATTDELPDIAGRSGELGDIDEALSVGGPGDRRFGRRTAARARATGA